MITINAVKQQKNKLLSFILVISLLLGVFAVLPIPVSAEEAVTFTDEQGLTYTVNEEDNTTVSVTAFNNSTASVVIPEKAVKGDVSYTVNAIDGNVFESNTIIESVEIPGTVTKISGGSFIDCSGLTSVKLCEGITTIDLSAFLRCKSLESIIFPKSMKLIAMNAFMDCTSLRSIEFNSDLELKAWSFKNCTSLEKVICYASNTNFNINAFLDIDTSIFTIYGYEGSKAEEFAKSKGYKFEVLSADTTVLNKLLEEAKSKSEIMFTEDSYKVLAGAIEKAENILKQEKPIKSEIEECVKELSDAIINLVSDNIKDGCIWQTINVGKEIEITGLVSQTGGTLTIPSEIKGLPVTSIGEESIYNVNYEEIKIADSVKVIKKHAFFQSAYLWKLKFSENSLLTTIEDGAFSVNDEVTWDKMTEIELPASLKTIGDKVFYERKNLDKVTIKSKDVVFGKDVFEGNNNVTLKGYENSTAQAYANANGHKFSYIGLDLTELKELLAQADAISPKSDALSAAIRAANILIAQIEIKGEGSPTDIANCIKSLKEAMETADDTTPQTEPTTSSTEPTTEPDISHLGDADGDGEVTVKDVTYIQLYLANLLSEDSIDLSVCDVDNDGEINVKDATYIQLRLANLL